MTGARRRIDVCVPLYAPEVAWLRELLHPLRRAQLLARVILREDPSDRTLGAASAGELAGEFPGLAIDYHLNPVRLGMVANWNALLADATADYLVLPGQDDVVDLAAVESLVERLDAEPDLAFAVYDRHVVDGTTSAPVAPGPQDRALLYERHRTYRLDAPLATRLCLRNGNVLGEPACTLLPRARVVAAGGWDEEWRHFVDLELLVRLLDTPGAACLFVAEPWATRREHAGSKSSSNLVDGSGARERIRMNALLSAHPGIGRGDRSLGHSFVATREAIRLPAMTRRFPAGVPAAVVRLMAHALRVLPWQWVRVGVELFRGSPFDRNLVAQAVEDPPSPSPRLRGTST